MRYIKLVLFILFPLINYSQSVNSVARDSIKDLEVVTITATRRETPTLETPYSLNLIHSKDINHFQFRSSPEALTGSTGVFIQKTNQGGGSPIIRGLMGNQILILVDGIRVNNSTYRYGPNQYFNTIDIYSVSRIEVARGTGSVQYGSDALGGVIQVFTKDPSFSEKKKIRANAQAKVVSQKMEFTSHGELMVESKKIGVLIGATIRDFGDLVGGDTTGIQSPSGYQETCAQGKVKLKFTDNTLFMGGFQYVEQTKVPLYHRVELENFNYYHFAPQQRQMLYAKVEHTNKINWMSKTTLTASLQNSLEKREYYKNGNANSFVDEDRVKTFGLTLDIKSKIRKNWNANSGVEYYNDQVKSHKKQTTRITGHSEILRGLYPDNATNSNFSLYTLHHFKLDRFSIEGGLRYNSSAIAIPDTVTTSLKTGDVNVTPSSVVSNVALLYSINDHQSVYSSFSTGYRTPNIDDMGTLGLVDFRYEIPAYDLKPEKTYNTEIGYRVIHKKLEINMSAFYMHLSNLIDRVQIAGEKVGGYNVYKKENTQESFIRGMEGSLDYYLSKYLTFKVNASYTYGQNLTKNEPIRRIPPMHGRAIFVYTLKQLQVSVEDIFAGKQSRLSKGDMDDNRISKGGTAGWSVLNFYSSYTLNKISIRSGFQNILNADYRTHGSGINGIGRSVFLALQINI